VAVEVRSAILRQAQEVALAFLDPVLHLAARAVDFLVEKAAVGSGFAQRGDDETRVGLALGPFRLADHPTPARPAVEGRIAEVLEAAGRLAGRGRFRLGLQPFDGDLLDEPRVAGEAEHEVDPVLFAPGHQRLAGEPGIGAQENARPGPARPDLADDPRDLLLRPGAAVDVRRPQLGRQKMPAAEHIERQIAGTIIIAVKEPAFLMAVQRIVGRVEVENDLFGRLCVPFEEEVDEQGLDRRRVVADLVVARGDLARPFEPIESVDLPATGAQSPRPASSLPASTAISGS
jgi:hypothetical protein